MKKFSSWLFLLPVAVFYFACLPSTVQGGDTGELVAAAFARLVAHPPGYPLWIWGQNLWLHMIPVGSVFWRAAFLNSLFSLSALALLCGFYSPSLSLWIVLPFIVFAPSFVEAAILPDVFALHALLVVAISLLYLSHWPRRALAISFLFFFSLAHHHTILFLFPILLFLAFEKKGKELILGGSLGIVGAALAYASLRLLKPESPFSWAT